ncbi:MAG: hypothetical protein IPM24_19510 [Bryobacterales bacterium]|nr:hypothetical protein [Bryobacterales bacterium]
MRRYAGGFERLCERVDFSYDTNPYDGGYTAHGWGRRTAARWGGAGCVGGITWYEMYSYTQSGRMTKRRLRLELSPFVIRDLDTTASYDTQGRLTTAAYPLTGEQHTYEFDTMGRPQKLRDQSWTYLVWDTAYGAADQMLTLATPQWTETRQYNARLQLTRIQQGSAFHLEYRYAASGNNGRVTQQKDWVSVEEINYSYDTRRRLTMTAMAAQVHGGEHEISWPTRPATW